MGSLTFLVLQPELLLDLLAGEVDAAAQLGAVQSLRHVVAPVLLEEGQQLPACALRRQGLQHLGEAWRVRGVGVVSMWDPFGSEHKCEINAD